MSLPPEKLSIEMPLRSGKPQTPCNLWTRNTIRLQIAFLLSAAMTICGLLRGNMGMALVCMIKSPINSTTHHEDSYTSHIQVSWTLQDTGHIHTAFYGGTFISVLLAHNLAEYFGPKVTISGGIIMNILASWSVPTVVAFYPHWFFTALLRGIMGMGQGVFVPCASLIIAKWFPMHEKSTAMAIFSTGNQVGLALAMFFTAELCNVVYVDGWPTSFYLYGMIGTVFMAYWLAYATDKPRKSDRISKAELTHIEEAELRLRAMSINLTIPYRRLLASPVILAICASSFCQSFVMVIMVSYLPEYYRSVLKLPLSKNGVWSAIPFFIQMFSKMGFAFVADYCKLHGVATNTVTKVSNNIASFGCAICLTAICFTTNGFAILALVCLGITLTSAFVPGYNTSIVSVAPSYTAVISAYAQGWAQIASVIAPPIVGYITRESSTTTEWRLIFLTIAGTCVVTGLFFQFFGSAEVQHWAVSIAQPIDRKDSTFTVHAVDSVLDLTPATRLEADSVQTTPRTSFLAVRAKQNVTKRTPHVSIMEENGSVHVPGVDDAAVDGVGLLPDDEEDDL